MDPLDQIIRLRRRHNSWKHRGPDDVLAMGLADMDFPSPEPIRDALIERAKHPFYGYVLPPPELAEIICERLQRNYAWTVPTDAIVYMPNVVMGFDLSCKIVGAPEDEIIVQTPIYPYCLEAPFPQQRGLRTCELVARRKRSRIVYGSDARTFEEALGPRTRMFLLCNPHNPTGRVFTRHELEQLAEVCRRRDVVICSDEIHCELTLGERRHIPIASLSPQMADRTITLMSASKTFNISGLGCGYAVIPNAALRQRFERALHDISADVNLFGFVGTVSAFTDEGCARWLAEVLGLLKTNRDRLAAELIALPNVELVVPEATYLMWIDLRKALEAKGVAAADAHRFVLERARLELGDGAIFGNGGAGFVRLNFACPSSIIDEGLGRLQSVLGKT